MPIPLLVIFSCGVGVPPAQKLDEIENLKLAYSALFYVAVLCNDEYIVTRSFCLIYAID